jgi:hypothetical protein
MRGAVPRVAPREETALSPKAWEQGYKPARSRPTTSQATSGIEPLQLPPVAVCVC